MTPPQAYLYHLAYDPATQQTLTFEESISGGIEPIWSFAAGTWANITPVGGLESQGLRGVSMAYDAAEGYVVLVGTSRNSGDETWEFKAGGWSELSPATEPYGSVMAGLTYDAADSSVILLTTSYSSGQLRTITWAYQGGNWSEVGTSLAPPPELATMAYDNSTSGHHLLLFDYGTYQSRQNETWTYHNGTWQNVTGTSGHAPPPVFATEAYDAADGFVLLVSSGTLAHKFTDRTWEYENGSWVFLSPPSTLPTLGGVSLVFDGQDGYPLTVGSGQQPSGANITTSTWKFDRTDIGGPPAPILTITPANVSVGQVVRVVASIMGGYGVISAHIGIMAPGCYVSQWRGLGAWNCTPTGSGSGLAVLVAIDQAGRSAITHAVFQIAAPPILSGWVLYAVIGAVGAIILASVAIVISRRRRRQNTSADEPLPPPEVS